METFENLNIKPLLARGISDLGFIKPSPIQAQTLPILLGANTDFIGLAATGTGKTAAFAIPLLEKLDPQLFSTQALVLCPTRELCLQVTEQFNLLGKHMGVQALAIYGGASYGDQFRGLRSGAHIVVGTPGRIIDHLERESLRLEDVEIVVLDEADEMISMGFREDMETILNKTIKEKRKIWLFSATMGPGVKKVADTFLEDAQSVHVNRGAAMLSATVEQTYFMTQEKNKPEVLCKIIDAADDFFGLVFCQTKSLVVDLHRYLSERGYAVDCLHGDMNQRERDAAMARFRERKTKVLVCTDVAARGLDVKDVSHVINYSIPRELDSYVHRIGRTARSGKSGKAISLVTSSHRHLLGRIEQLTKSSFSEGILPSRKQIAIKKVAALFETFQQQGSYQRAADVLDERWHNALQAMDSREVAGRFINMLLPDLFNDRAIATMERSDRDPHEREQQRGDRGNRKGHTRSFNRDRNDRRERKPFKSRERLSELNAAPSTETYNDQRHYSQATEGREHPRANRDQYQQRPYKKRFHKHKGGKRNPRSA
ncbi:MAG: DEAD/DEAH box helicase [Oligoflexia bacterium]|nr:DEAD/DEAH box helicase [Oligoflexia bacterium]